MDKVLSNKKTILMFLLPCLLLYLAIVIVPILISGYFSLLDWNGIGKGSFAGLSNYVQLFKPSSNSFFAAIWHSLILVLMSVFIQLPLALLLALVLAGKVRGGRFFRMAAFLPVVISTVAVAQLWLKIFQPDYGLLNSLLRAVGLDGLTRQWLSNPKTALYAALAPTVWQYIGYHMLLLYCGVKAIPAEVFESAAIDGANAWQRSIHITIPLMKSVIQSSLIFAVIGSLKVFDIVYVMTKGGPLHASEVPATLMYNEIFQRNHYGYGSAMSVFIVLECLLMTLLIQRIFRSKESL